MPNSTLYKVTVKSPLHKTVYDYLNDSNSPAYEYAATPDIFLAVKSDGDNLTNRQRLELDLNKKPETKLFIGQPAENLPLTVGTVFYLEYPKVNYQSFITEGIEVVSYDSIAFESAEIAKLKADKGYVQVSKPQEGQRELGTSKETFPDCTVWMWLRSLSSKNDGNELLGQLFDVTPYVQRLQTNVGKNGGNFTITLPPLTTELDENNRWQIKAQSISNFQNGEYVSEVNLYDEGKADELSRSQFFFQNAVTSNDLIFIRFEALQMEKEQRLKDAEIDIVDKSNLPNRIYDMIGLVDSVSTSLSPQNNDLSINISGRDLLKLFIEDGTYFYALENSEGVLKFAGQSQLENGQINRILGDGATDFLSLYMYNSIEYILKFIIQQLSNIKIVPDELFEAYGERRNKKYNVIADYKNTPNPEFTFKEQVTKPVPAKGIWSIVKLVLDETILGRLLQDSSFSMAQGSLLNFIRTACQEPLVQFYGDTMGDQYVLTVRKPPYDKKSVVSLLNGRISTEDGNLVYNSQVATVLGEDVLQENLVMDDTQIYSWYSMLPKSNYFGNEKDLSLAYLGALYFPEYADVWGAKPLQIVHPYVAYVPSNSPDKGITGDELQAINDYKYLIESNQYLPFTRKGTLVLNGDRRIKVGNIIRYEPTKEIFFVDSVQQNFTINENVIDRTTTIQVSRGMIESFIYGVEVEDEKKARHKVGYFDIINTKLITEQTTKKVPYTETVVVGTETVDAPPVLSQKADESPVALLHPNLVTGQGYLNSYNPFPIYKNKFIRFINFITESGYAVTITSTYRTYQEQLNLWNKYHGKRAVAVPGTSKHEVGNAIDINLINIKTGDRLMMKSSLADWQATGVPAIAKSMGIQWGDERHIGQFGGRADRVHFQIPADATKPKTIIRNKTKQETKYKDVQAIDKDKVFSNFKVNKFVFNFFLKNLQFDPKYRMGTFYEFGSEDGEIVSEQYFNK